MRLRHLLVATAALAVPSLASAQSETSASAEVTASTGYSANPFSGQVPGTDQSSGYVEVRVRPKVVLRTARDTFTLVGDAQLQQYFRRYSTRDNYSARANYSGQWSERLTATAAVGYLNAISGSSFAGVGVTTDPATPVPPIVSTDLGLFGSGNRRQTIDGQIGASYILSDRDQINAYGSALTTSNSRPGQAVGYDSYGGGFGYSRRLNTSLKVGVNASVNTTQYQSSGDTTVYNVEATLDARLNELWSVNGGIGISRLDGTTVSPVFGVTSAQTTISGNLSLCRRGERGNLCLNASRAVLPSSFGGARTQTQADLYYGWKLSSRASVNARAGFTQVDGNDSGFAVLGQRTAYRYYTASLGYQRKVGERLNLSASAVYRKVTGGLVAQDDDYGGQIGIAYVIGKRR